LFSSKRSCVLILDEKDEYEESFKRMKDESLRSRQVKMQEEYEEATKEVEKWRERLAEKRKEVDFWMNKVDKSCIERIRTFQTPPILIGQIMEMGKEYSLQIYLQDLLLNLVLTLIGRKPAVRLDAKDHDRDKGLFK
jgi:ATP-dependent 26S proteasome regulatory subunit